MPSTASPKAISPSISSALHVSEEGWRCEGNSSVDTCSASASQPHFDAHLISAASDHPPEEWNAIRTIHVKRNNTEARFDFTKASLARTAAMIVPALSGIEDLHYKRPLDRALFSRYDTNAAQAPSMNSASASWQSPL